FNQQSCMHQMTPKSYPNKSRQLAALSGVVERSPLEVVSRKDVSSANVAQHAPGGPLQRLNVIKVGQVWVDQDALPLDGCLVDVALAGDSVHRWEVGELRKTMALAFRSFASAGKTLLLQLQSGYCTAQD